MPTVTKAQIASMKIALQAEFSNSHDAKTFARLCVGSAESVITALQNGDVAAFSGALLNAAGWYNDAQMFDLGVNEDERNRRNYAVRKIIFHGRVE